MDKISGTSAIVLFFILFVSNGIGWFMLNALTARVEELRETMLRVRS